MGLLKILPSGISSISKDWPWTKEVDPSIYNNGVEWPKISIVTPSFNQGKFIEETIRSIILQNYPKLEYIIIDGGSTDETVDIIKKYDQWVTYWSSEKDNGQSSAINKGFNQASGDIINWINSDDILCESALYKLALSFLQVDKSVAFIYGQCIHFDANGDKPFVKQPHDNLPLRYYYSFPYAQPSAFYRKDILSKIGCIDESLKFAMDFDFFVRIALNYEMMQIPDIISKFRWHSNSKSTMLETIREAETKLIICTLLQSLNASQHIEVLKETGLYKQPQKVYKVSKQLSQELIDNIFLLAFAKYVFDWYKSGDFRNVEIFCSFLVNREGGSNLIKSIGLYEAWWRSKYLGSKIINSIRWVSNLAPRFSRS